MSGCGGYPCWCESLVSLTLYVFTGAALAVGRSSTAWRSITLLELFSNLFNEEVMEVFLS